MMSIGLGALSGEPGNMGLSCKCILNEHKLACSSEQSTAASAAFSGDLLGKD